MNSKVSIILPSGEKATITDVIAVAPILESQLQRLVETPNYNGTNTTSMKSISARFRVVITALRYVIKHLEHHDLIQYGLDGFVCNDFSLLKRVMSSKMRIELSQQLIFALKVYTGQEITGATLLPKSYLRLAQGETEVSDLYEYSPILVQDLRLILESDRYQGNKGHDVRSVSARFRAVLTACRYVIHHIDDAISLKNGLSGFKENDFCLLKLTYRSGIKSWLFNELLIALGVYWGTPVLRHQYQENLLPFYFSEHDIWRHIDCSDLAECLPNILSEMQSLHESEISLLAQKNYNMETLHTRFSKAKRLLLNYLHPNFPEQLQEHGLRALGRDNNKIQKSLFQTIQSQVQAKTISLGTGKSYFEVVRWLMAYLGLQPTDAYRISMQRYQRHAKRAKLEKTYSDEELVELIFHLEKAFAVATESKTKVALLFAKIQIKTCWNTAPLCGVELTDINEIELPTAKKTMLIMVQKARKNYDIDTYKLDGRTVNSVMRDLQAVKALTDTYRQSESNFSHLLFIYQEYGEIYPIITGNIVAHINSLLEAQGCRVRYNSQRMRTTGANDIYLQVAKDLRKYKQAMRHSFSTFIQHYQQVKEAETQTTLSDAVDTMQSYFTGREISSDIIILENDEPACQQTPSGLCASLGSDDEAIQYHKEHRLLHNQSGREASWCSDYLACIWCKYFRTVADPEHVWQLLSYRDYVLEDMAASITNLEQNEQQAEYIEILRNRVEQILEQLRLRDPKAVERGLILQTQNGLHPYWSFAVTSVSI